MQQRALSRHWREPEVERPALRSAVTNSSNNCVRAAMTSLIPGPGSIAWFLVAQGQQASRFETDDRGFGGDRRSQCVEHAAGLLARLVNQPGAEKSAAAAQRPSDRRLQARRTMKPQQHGHCRIARLTRSSWCWPSSASATRASRTRTSSPRRPAR